MTNDARQRILEISDKVQIQTVDKETNVDFYSVSVPLQGLMTKLRISNVQDSDIGVYAVEVENTVGLAEEKRTRLVYMGNLHLIYLFCDPTINAKTFTSTVCQEHNFPKDR